MNMIKTLITYPTISKKTKGARQAELSICPECLGSIYDACDTCGRAYMAYNKRWARY